LPIQASDSNGDPLTYQALGLPPGLAIDSSTGVISGTVAYGAAADSSGVYNPTIIVDDGNERQRPAQRSEHQQQHGTH